MPASSMRCITDATGFSRYLLSPKKQNIAEAQLLQEEIADERVLYAGSTMLADANLEQIDGLRDEFKLFAGRKYDGISLRISLAKDEHLTGEQWKNYVAEIMKEYLSDRNYIFVIHNDGQNNIEHAHIIATFLDKDGKWMNFAGHRQSEKEAERQQEIVNKISEIYGLRTLPIVDGNFNRRTLTDADTRQTIAIRNRLQDTDADEPKQNLWLDELKKDFKQACRTEKTADAVLQRLADKGWHLHRETEKHITLSKNIDGKNYKVRLGRLDRNLPNRKSLQAYLDKRNSKPTQTPTDTLSRTPITPCASNGASAGTPGVAGTAVADENDTEDIKHAIAIYNREQAQIAMMAGQIAEVENEVNNIMMEDMLEINDAVLKLKNRR
jgi:MobA/VirD2-like, nuclease domain